jgi:4-amino-4-deoxy-L-arabinose transferase-like glycosyltransferase
MTIDPGRDIASDIAGINLAAMTARDVPAGSASIWERLLAALAATHARACAALIVLALACFLPGFLSLQPMDRDEPRFAQATKQMLETGDFVDIRFQDEARHKKPVGIYWLQSASVKAAEALGVPEARVTIGVYRVPSLLGAIGVVLATYWAALAFVGRRAAFLAGVMMASSILLGVEARLAKTDAVLALSATLMLGGLARAWLTRDGPLDRSTMVIFWAATALGVLVKGPIVLMIAGLATLVLSLWNRSAGWFMRLRPGLGLLLVAAVVLPWFVAIAFKSDGAFFQESVGKDMFGKVAGQAERHGAPPGLYFLAFFATFWPGAALVALAGPYVWATRREPEVIFCLAWIIPSWVIFELVPIKLPHYVLPLYPALAILTVLALTRGALRPLLRGAGATAALMPLIPVLLAGGLAFGAYWLDGAVPFLGLPLLFVSALVALAGARSFLAERPVDAIGQGVVAGFIAVVAVFGLIQPVLSSLKLSPRLAAAAKAVGCEAPAIVTAGYREPSLVFLVGTELAMADGAEAARFLTRGGCRIAFVTQREDAAFQAELARLSLRPAMVTRVTGFNINGGRKLDIGVFAVRP